MTRLDPCFTAAYGVDELHAVVFAPAGDRDGPNRLVVVAIPETVEGNIEAALRLARAGRMRLLFVCDTGPQADAIAERAAKGLPGHRRVPLEIARAGLWGPPS